MNRCSSRHIMFLGLLFLAPLTTVYAQSGSIAGTVKSGGQGLPAVHVYALTGPTISGEAQTNESGFYRIKLPPGEYSVVFRLPGYSQRRIEAVQVGAAGDRTLDTDLGIQTVELNKVIVSAGRHAERVLDVAGAVNVVDEAAIQRKIATSPLDYVMSTPGVDVAVQGLEGRQMVGRGFNGTFGPSLLLLSDYRNAALPSVRASLSYFLTPNGDDLDRVEVIRGPASALYGSNAADGVVHFITKSPFNSAGTSLSLTGGDRSLFEGTGRYAAVVNDKLAYKFSGTYFRGREWEALPQPSEIQARNPVAERVNAEFRADYRFTPAAVGVLTVGTTEALRNVDYTTIGTYQLDHSRADFAQLRFSSGALFAQVYVNSANSPSGATVNLQTRQTAIDHSNVVAAQIQNGFDFSRTNLTYGVDVQRTNPRTEGTVYGRNENDDSSIEAGVFAQSSTKLSPKLQLVGAARVDDNNRIRGVVFSPRLGIVFTPYDGQRFRLSYNRAFSTPTPGNLFLDVVAASLNPLPFTIRAVGVPRNGFHFARDCGGLCMSSPFAPGQKLPVDATLLWPAVVQILKAGGVDISGLPAPKASDVSTVLRSLDLRNGSFVAASGTVNDIPRLLPTTTNSFEAGYKGLVGQQLVFDGSVYATQRKNFVTPLAVATPNVFFSTPSLAAYLGRFLPAAQAGALAAAIGGVDGNAKAPGIPVATIGPTGAFGGSDILLTYHNVGDVKLWGADLSAEYFANDNFSFSGSYSYVSDNLFPATRPGDTDLSTNTPRNKALLSGRAHTSVHDASVELRGRYVGGFRMVDGVWNGNVDGFSVGDIEAGAAIPGSSGARFTLTVQNFTDKRHSEFYQAPILGRLVLARVNYRF